MKNLLDSISTEQLLSDYVIPWSINIVMALVIFIVGRLVVKMIVSLSKKLMKRASMDETLIKFISSIAQGLLMLFVVVAAIDQLGVDTTSLIALVGAAGVAIGLALQGSLQNFAAGVMLILFRPFKSGDTIEAAGISGTVEQVSIFSTTLKTPDNKVIIVPNGEIHSGTITNYSANTTRRVDMIFGIGYDDDIGKAREAIQEILSSDERIIKNPEPKIAVSELADSSVNFIVRPWVNSSDYWPVKFDTTEKIKLKFDELGISIPYPQMDVHLEKAA